MFFEFLIVTLNLFQRLIQCAVRFLDCARNDIKEIWG